MILNSKPGANKTQMSKIRRNLKRVNNKKKKSNKRKKKSGCLQHRVSTMIDNMDFHMWVVKDGEIIDPHFKEYDAIKFIRGCIMDRTSVMYEPFPVLLQQEILEKEYKTVGRLADTKELIDFFADTPQCYKCMFNSICYQKKYGGDIVVGRLGWKREDGTVWWEFG